MRNQIQPDQELESFGHNSSLREEKSSQTGFLGKLNQHIRSTKTRLFTLGAGIGLSAVALSTDLLGQSNDGTREKTHIEFANGNPDDHNDLNEILEQNPPPELSEIPPDTELPETEKENSLPLLEIAYWIVIFGMTIKGVLRTKHVFESLKWLEEESQKMKREAAEIVKKKACQICVILPAYKEQSVIEETMEYFAELPYPNLKVIVVTTDKEKPEDESATTMDIVKQATERLNQESEEDVFSWVHYPHADGGMKEQVNYAVTDFSESLPEEDWGRSYIAVYNADSKPNPKTLEVFNAMVQKEGVEVAVQNSVHFSNFDQLPFNPSGILLKAASVFQNRWSMEEISMQRKQAKFWESRDTPLDTPDTLREKLAYCIGHGSFFRLDIWNDAGGFPQDCELDDLPLGFLLSCKGVSIKPIPLLESCETPTNIRDLINQKANWYRMMIGYMDPRRAALDRELDSHFRIDFLTFKSFLRDAASWGLVSPSVLLSLVTPLITGSPIHYGASAAGLTLYSLINTWKILKEKELIADLSDGNEITANTLQKLMITGATIPYCLLASLGPYKTLIRKVLGLNYNEHKTNRQTDSPQ